MVGGRCVCRRRVPRGRRVRFGASMFVREEKAHRRPPSSPATPGPRRFGVPVHGPQLLCRVVGRRLRSRSSKISCFGRRPIGIRRGRKWHRRSHRTETAHGVLLLRRGPRGRHLGIMSPRLFFHGAACIPVVPSIHTAIPRLIFARRRHAFRNAAPSVALVTANPHV